LNFIWFLARSQRNFSDYNVEWSHDAISKVGPALWYRKFPVCSKGRLQSPINIRKKPAKTITTNEKLTITNMRAAPNSITVKNAQDSLFVFYNFSNSRNIPQISGGPLESSFNFTSINFRWRSGHLIDLRRFDVELQLNFDGNVKVSFMMQVTKHELIDCAT
jgi:carbonic anhydrase